MVARRRAIPTLGLLLALSMASSPVSSFAEPSNSDSVTVQVDMGSGNDVSCVGESSTLTLPNNSEPQTLERAGNPSTWSNGDDFVERNEFESPSTFTVSYAASDCAESTSLGFLEVSRGSLEHMALGSTEFLNAEENAGDGPSANENLGYADLVLWLNGTTYHGNLTPGGENFIVGSSAADQSVTSELYATMTIYGSNPTGTYRVEYLFQLNVGPGDEMLSNIRYSCFIEDNCP